MRSTWRIPLVCAIFALALYAQPATVTGRVFDVYHRPVRGSRVATMARLGAARVVAETSAVVDDAGMYRLSLQPGRYILAVLPPPHPLDFATVFPAYLPDTVEFDKAQPISVGPGEIRPFVDFLLLDVESHRLQGEVKEIPAGAGAITVALSPSSGFLDPIQIVPADSLGRFHLDHVPAGSYELQASWASSRSASVRVEVRKPEIRGIEIHLRAAAR
jgi:hypothetical protein